MASKFERMPNEPILLASLTGNVTPEDIYQIYAATAKLADDLRSRVYRITDVGATTMNFGDLVDVMATAARGQPGSPSDPRVTSVMVGNSETFRMYSEGFKQSQYGQRNIPLYADYAEALAYLREQIVKAEAQTHQSP